MIYFVEEFRLPSGSENLLKYLTQHRIQFTISGFLGW